MRIFILFSFFFASSVGMSQPTGELPIETAKYSTKENFQLGVKEFNKGNFKNAELHFLEVLKQVPAHAQAHYNLGLTYFNLSKIGLALGHWRTALNLNPSFSEARKAINELAGSEQNFQTMILSHLNVIPFEAWGFLGLALLFVFGWKYLEKVGQKRSYLRGGEAPKEQPWFVLASLATGLLCVGVFSFLLWEQSLKKATIVVAQVELRSGPNQQSSALIELKEGLEILVQDEQKEWLQVEEPRGLTGWLLKDQIMLTSRWRK